MIIFGTRTRVGVVERGQFGCPRCGPGQSYERKHAKRWFTLYFIPVFPVGDLGQFIECGLCHGTFKTEVLSLRLPPAVDVNLEVELKRAMLRALLWQVPVETDAASTLATYRKLTSLPLTDQDLARERTALAQVDAPAYFSNFSKHLSPSQRERVLQSAIEGAHFSGPLSPTKVEELSRFGALIGLTEASVRGLLSIATLPAATA
ncbi:MAG: zinc-ribbon domain-containing protein [Deltaproteobacteria bacterium]|nr:zinc-ribbon domain-containing protein [Deltaproteobacteria bacterium]